MRSKFAVIGIVATLAVLAGAIYWMRDRPDAPMAATPVEGDAAAGDSAAGPSGPSNASREAMARTLAAARRAPPSTAPLPSLDTPLRTAVAELAARAKAGDARAMCRLAAEYQYCSDLQARMQLIESGVNRAQFGGDEGLRRGGQRSAEGMAAAFDDASERYRHCEGVSLPSSEEAARYMRQAAVAGHPQASSYYVSGDMFRPRDTLDNLAELAFYRDNAEMLARAAIADGDLAAAWSLANAYAADPADMRRSLLSQVVDPAPDKALALMYALRSATGSATGSAGAQQQESGRMLARLEQRIATLERQLPQADVARARSEPSGLGTSASVNPRSLSQASPGRGRGGWGGGERFDRGLCD